MLGRDSSTRDVDWFRDLHAFKRLDLEPPYQRYSVWSTGYKQHFIDTILNDYPSPSIVLHKESVSGDEHIYHVVDGKQRLLAITDFQKNLFAMAQNHDQYAGMYWDDLPEDVRMRFGNYLIPVEILTTDSLADLREAFDRLNRNVRRLNKQELQHARHEGPFITLMESLARAGFWRDIRISSRARVRTMRDVEFVSEVFLLQRTACKREATASLMPTMQSMTMRRVFRKWKGLGMALRNAKRS